jgi:hypothetical protein
MAKADYDRAVKAFGECDHDLARTYLEKIPEPLVPYLTLPCLPFIFVVWKREQPS